jgi:hypothetical protein
LPKGTEAEKVMPNEDEMNRRQRLLEEIKNIEHRQSWMDIDLKKDEGGWLQVQALRNVMDGWKTYREIALNDKTYLSPRGVLGFEERTISIKHHSIYIHIPKTGGSSVAKCMDSYSLYTSHLLTKDVHLTSQLADLFCYTFLRDPYERVVSTYGHVFKSESLLALFAHYGRTEERLTMSDSKETWQKFPHVMPTPQSFTFERFVEIITNELWNIMWEPQTSWIYNDNKEEIVNFIGRTETLQQDLDKIRKMLNIEEEIKVPHLNVTDWGGVDFDYKDVYDESTKKKVEKYYEKDIEYLKVKF